MKFNVFCPAVLLLASAILDSQICVQAVPIANTDTKENSLLEGSDVTSLAQWDVASYDLTVDEKEDQFNHLSQLFLGTQDDLGMDMEDHLELAQAQILAQKHELTKGSIITIVVICIIFSCCVLCAFMQTFGMKRPR